MAAAQLRWWQTLGSATLAVGVALDALAPGGGALLGPQLLLGVGVTLVASVWAALARRRARVAARVRA